MPLYRRLVTHGTWEFHGCDADILCLTWRRSHSVALAGCYTSPRERLIRGDAKKNEQEKANKNEMETCNVAAPVRCAARRDDSGKVRRTLLRDERAAWLKEARAFRIWPA
ncbi:hypothetical protein IVA79_03170 [Bradyrhizobium sp. 138]|uniref:hypothetical protein n=1 Tax=Bradyrhizobium sp. 138 TaxID=2782615 RepID=UPI001FFB1BBD|nr:hypothetical protein [Bradyrhizobium sp. 138]MCK1732979.1 hypothetical protein [Bradyrhizobium sp. 138]